MKAHTCEPRFSVKWQPYMLSAGFGLLVLMYYFWTWSRELGDFGGDNAFYLLTARHYSPWSPSSLAASYFAHQSQYPPLYPLVLGLLGGGESILAAHLITTTILLGAFLLLYRWVQLTTGSSRYAAIILGQFALLPGTLLQALSILSENLYLFLSLVSLIAVALSERGDVYRMQWLFAAAISVAAATLTRSAAFALLVTFLLYLLIHRPSRWWVLGLVATLPMAIWNFAFGTGGTGYARTLQDRVSNLEFSGVSQYIGSQLSTMWYGWTEGFSITYLLTPALVVCGFAMLAGFIVRLRGRTFDGLYLALYLSMVLLWPFPAETSRLVYPVIPVMMVHGLIWCRQVGVQLNARFAATSKKSTVVGYVFLLALVAISGFVLIGLRFSYPLPEDLSEYSRNRSWYSRSIALAQKDIFYLHGAVSSLRAIDQFVPADTCIFTIKPSLVGLYSDRIGKFPPLTSDNARFNEELKSQRCSYAIFLSGTSPSVPIPFYPRERLKSRISDVMVVRLGNERDGPVVSILSKIDSEK